MKLLIVHQNFPGQYLPLATWLAKQPGHEIVFLTQRKNVTLPGIRVICYEPPALPTGHTHPFLRRTEEYLLIGQRVAQVAEKLKRAGFEPDAMLGHCGWGEMLYLKDVYPNVPMIGFFEFFYRAEGADTSFNSPAGPSMTLRTHVRTKNIVNLLSLDAADAGQTPTHWQHSLHPEEYKQKIRVIHEGVDTQVAHPNPAAKLRIPNKNIVLTRQDEVLTYVARNLEAYRGFPEFMRSLPEVLRKRPKVQVLIVGADGTSYGPPPAEGGTYRELMCKELGDQIDWSRVHFMGRVPYTTYLRVLQVSSVHLYLTYPFVLSWSMLEAMSSGCLVVGSRTAPVLEVLEDQRNGILVDFSDHSEISSTVSDALSNRASLDHLRMAARGTVVKRYDSKSIGIPAQLKLIGDLVGSGGRVSR